MPKGLSISPLPPLQPRPHALVMRAAPVHAAAGGAVVEGFAGAAGVVGDARCCGFVGGNQRGVVDQAAGEGAGQPVETVVRGDPAREVVERGVRQDQRDVGGGLVFGDQRVLRQEMAAFFAALPQQFGVALAVVREQRVVTGGAQVAAQVAQHFVAEEARHGSHGAILIPNGVDDVLRLRGRSDNWR